MVRGKVTDNNGETVIGAAVVFKNDPSNGVVTDFDGNYELEIKRVEPVVLMVAFIGFKNAEKTVNPKNGKVEVVNFDLVPQNYDIGEVVIEAKADKAGDYYMEKIKKNSATSIDYISNETMRKVGDLQVSSAIQRVSGVSSVGGFVTVRGLADRYVLTAVNGSRIPTLDPLTNNFDVNIFPTGLVDNIVITKTGAPDLPGEWSGAFISVETKDFPDKLSIQVSSSIGYNTNASLQTIVSTEKSDTDWLGWDDGFRDVPSFVPEDQSDFPRYISNPSLNQQLHVLGLGSFLNGYGITDETLINPNFNGTGNAFFRLGLVELGYIEPANFNDQNSYNAGFASYQNDYSRAYFRDILNQELEAIGQAWPNNLSPIQSEGSLNYINSFTIGNQTKVFGKTLGFNFGLRHSRTNRADHNPSINRVINTALDSLGNGDLSFRTLSGEVSEESADLNILANLSLKLNSNNSFSLMLMPNFQGTSKAQDLRVNADDSAGPELPGRSFGNTYEERRQLIYQFSSNHYIPTTKGRLTTRFSYTDGRSSTPGLLQTRFPLLGADEGSLNPPEDTLSLKAADVGLENRFRSLDDDIIDAGLAYEFPALKEMESILRITIGGAYFKNDRISEQDIFPLLFGGTEVFPYSPETGFSEALTPEKFELGASDDPFYYQNNTSIVQSSVGFKEISSGFLKFDYKAGTRLRLVGGLRVEHSYILVDIKDYYDRDLPFDSDERRFSVSLNGGNPINESTIEKTDFLPSINIIYELRSDNQNPINLRLNYFRSLARPSFKEISPVTLFDFGLRGRLIGNPDLNFTYVDNYDLRAEFYMTGGNNVSASFFYKTFKDHIELISFATDGDLTWDNQQDSYALGFEIEGLYNITNSLSARGNVTLIKSQTKATQPVEETRTMFGQAPYIINAILTYDLNKLGLTFSGSYNVQGRKLAVVRSGITPNVYEMPRHLVDVNLSKQIGKHFSASFRVRNLLNSPARRTYDYSGVPGAASDFNLVDFDRYQWGTDYILGLTYTL